MSDLDRLFGDEARARIEAAVKSAEARTIGQIVPVVVERSEGYPEARYRGGLLGAALATLVALLFFPHLPMWELPLFQVAGGIVGALVALWDPLERFLAGRTELELASRDRALRAFHEHGLQNTSQGTGVLVFASLFEHRAVVLGDHGIHAKIGEVAWQRAVAALVDGMRRSDPAAGFCSAVELCGAALAEHFPRAPGGGPGNELGDAIQVSRS